MGFVGFSYGNQISEPSPLVTLSYVPFALCDGTNGIYGKLYCNAEVENYCQATKIFKCKIQGFAELEEDCGLKKKFCNDNFNLDKKYKGEAACTDTKPTKPGTTDPCTVNPAPSPDAFFCTQAGVFPDLKDCSKYKICPSQFGTAVSQSCPSGYSFDPSLSDSFPCRNSVGRDDLCITVTSCSEGKSQKLEYRNMGSELGEFGIQCNGGMNFVYRCGPNTVFTFEGTNVFCKPTCSTEGQIMADSQNLAKYNVCKTNPFTNVFELETRDCSAGKYFDIKQKECVYDIEKLQNDLKKVTDTLDDFIKNLGTITSAGIKTAVETVSEICKVKDAVPGKCPQVA